MGRVRKNSPLCGAQLVNREGTCKQVAGAGTDHVGIGRCKFHGGSTKSHKLAAAKEMVRRRGTAFYGDPQEVTPSEALLGEVRRTAGHVAYLEKKIAEEELRPDFDGEKVSTQIEALRMLYAQERKHLTQVCQVTLHAGVEERAVRVAERWGTELAAVLGAILEDLKLSASQREVAPEIVSRHLKLLEGGRAA